MATTAARLMEAIVDANLRAVRGDANASLTVGEHTDALPLVALTCVDPRLNRLLPGALGLPAEQFIWLRNAGNIITSAMSSTMRSLALACAIKGGREIAIIGHSDCKVRQTSMLELLDGFGALGVQRAQMPDDLHEFFGLFASERQNVMRAVEFIRSSPLIGPKVPVHGLLIDVQTGALEWLVNGYHALDTIGSQSAPPKDVSSTVPDEPAAKSPKPSALPAPPALKHAQPVPNIDPATMVGNFAKPWPKKARR